MRHRGFEPRTTWLKVKCSTDWANIPCGMPRAGIEPATQGFSVLCSTNWAIWAWVAGVGFEPTTFGLWARRASRLLHPAMVFNCIFPAFRRRLDGEGFEPSKASLTDLQSAPFGLSGIHPLLSIHKTKADDRTRTDNLLITNQLLCQLSPIGHIHF